MTTPLLTAGADYVYHCKAEQLFRWLPDNSVDCIVTDPPYGIGKAEWDGCIPLDWLTEAWRVTKRIIVMTGNPEMIAVGHAVGRVQNVVVLHARNGMTRSKTGFANWFPALICGEWGWEPRQNYLGFTVSITEKIPHPSPKPLAAMQKLIAHYTKPGWVICDPFCGSGTTLLAVQQAGNGRKYIGCDMSAEYVALTQKRLAKPFDIPLFAEATA